MAIALPIDNIDRKKTSKSNLIKTELNTPFEILGRKQSGSINSLLENYYRMKFNYLL